MDLYSGSERIEVLEQSSVLPSQAPGLRSFKLFTKLATEIQLMILNLALPGPRSINLEWTERDGMPYSRNSPPALLHVCSLSREEALKVYKPLFKPTSSYPIIYFNPFKDVLSVSSPPLALRTSKAETHIPYVFSCLAPQICSSLRSLTLDRRLWCLAWSHGKHQSLSNGQGLSHLQNLSTLTINMHFSKDPSLHKRPMDLSSMMCALDIVSSLSHREEPALYGRLKFARRFVGLHNRIEGMELERLGRLDVTAEKVGRDLEAIGGTEKEWRVPELKVVACVRGDGSE